MPPITRSSACPDRLAAYSRTMVNGLGYLLPVVAQARDAMQAFRNGTDPAFFVDGAGIDEASRLADHVDNIAARVTGIAKAFALADAGPLTGAGCPTYVDTSKVLTVTDTNLGLALHPPSTGPMATEKLATPGPYNRSYKRDGHWYTEYDPLDPVFGEIGSSLGLQGVVDTIRHPTPPTVAVTGIGLRVIRWPVTIAATGIGALDETTKEPDAGPMSVHMIATRASGVPGAAPGSAELAVQKEEWAFNIKEHPDSPNGDWYWQRDAYGRPIMRRSTIDDAPLRSAKKSSETKDPQVDDGRGS